MIQAFLPFLRIGATPENPRNVINIASIDGCGKLNSGYNYAYGASKGAIERMAGALAVEHPGAGLSFYNVEPGFVMTEAMHLNDPDGKLSETMMGAPPSAPASVVAWLATDPAAREWNGQTISAQPFCLEKNLHPDWR